MVIRASKCALLFAIGLFYLLVVFNNTTDYDSNYQFVHHVLMMDSTFPGNSGMWRAINPSWVHHAFYDSIIAWEAVTMALATWGSPAHGSHCCGLRRLSSTSRNGWESLR